MHRNQTHNTHSASAHAEVQAHTCLRRGLGKNHQAGHSSQHAAGWRGCFPAGFGGGVSEQSNLKGPGGDRKKRLKPVTCVWLSGLSVHDLEGLLDVEATGPPTSSSPILLPLSSPFLLPLPCSPPSPLAPLHPWRCQELLPPGSWGSLLSTRPPWGLRRAGLASGTRPS